MPVKAIQQPKQTRVFKVINKRGTGSNKEVLEKVLNDGFLIATDLTNALLETNLIVLVKHVETN